ncbi:MAG: FtsW/RodA/SpoVE family cell cycle protein [Oscillospiraceae bacterium]|nr:FtsW/RodA/SpoVE family cell cycle protein [Oscillospiraceae bacterium]
MTIFAEFFDVLCEKVNIVFGDRFSDFTHITRYILPALSLWILLRCAISLLREKQSPEEWGYLTLPGGVRVTLRHWENIIGRGKSADVFINYPTVSRTHGALIRKDSGVWTIYDLGSKTGVLVNAAKIKKPRVLSAGDIINIGGVDMIFVPIDRVGERIQAESRRRFSRKRQGFTLILLNILQLFLSLQFIAAGGEHSDKVLAGFFGLSVVMWATYIFTRIIRRNAFELETMAFLLTTAGFAVTATSVPEDMLKQVLFLTIGVVLYFVVGWFLRSLNSAVKLKWPIAAVGLLLLAVNIVLSDAVFGAKNWLTIGGFSFQPSEFVKVCFIFAGAASLDRMFARRNLIMFIGFAACCVLALVIMSDLGTGIIFFVTYLIIAFLRSGSIGTVFLSVGGAGLAAVMAVSVKPYIASRFSTWRHAWETPYDGGYQQTRTMSAAASGGLFGVGAGNGWLENVFAANTDMVFGVICEELGLIMAVILIFTVLLMAVYAFKYASNARSSFYTIASVSTASLLVFQMMLNVLGCVDILPFTGVTFPFVSKGGSSLIACFGLLAFLKACDTRQNASFTVKMPKKVKIKNSKTKAVRYDTHTDYDFDEESDAANSGRVDNFFDGYDDRWMKDD